MLRNIGIVLLLMVTLLSVSACHGEAGEASTKKVFVFFDMPAARGPLNEERFRCDFQQVFCEDGEYEMVYLPLFPDQFPSDSTLSPFLSRRVRECMAEGKHPSVFLTVGDRPASLLARSEDSLFRNIPIIYIGVQAPELIPEIRTRSNMTGRWFDIDYKKSIDFIKQMGGELCVMTQMEKTAIDSVMDIHIRQQLTDTVHYRYDYDHTNPGRLIEPSERQPDRMLLVPISFKEKSSAAGKDVLEDDGLVYRNFFDCYGTRVTYLHAKSDYDSALPFRGSMWNFYTMLPEQFNLPISSYVSSCVGGYFTPYIVMLEEAKKMVDGILKDGILPSQMEPCAHEANYWIDWAEYATDGMFASDLPRYVKFVNLPWHRRNRFTYWLWKDGWVHSLLAFITISIVLLLTSFFSRKKEENRLLARGHEAVNQNQYVIAALAATNSFMWRLEDGILIADEGGAEGLGFNTNKIELEALLECIVKPDDRVLLADLLTVYDENSEAVTMEVAAQFRNRPVHTFKVEIHYVNYHNTLIPVGTMSLIDDELQHRQSVFESLEKEEKSQMREAFLASMGHEIRTPINAIVGFSNIIVDMRGEMEQEELKNCYDLIESNLDQLLTLLDDVMHYSAESDDLKKSMITIPAGELVDELYRTHSVIVPKHLTFLFEKGDPTVLIHVSRTSVRQIVSNLINNACKFTPSGSVTLGWTSDEEHVSIYVEDTGIGLSSEDLDNIFSLYFKKDFTTDGAGIGLSLCSKLAHAMDGELSATSTLGKGSRFVLNLPKIIKN